jgi:PKD repeat protein
MRGRFFIIALFPVLIYSCQENGNPPVAEFEADTTTIEKGGSVQFSDLSLGEPAEWNWRFEAGDPQISHIPNPAIIYHNPGEYEVRLSVSNDAGMDVLVKDNYIKVLSPYPKAEFIADSTTIEIEGIVRYTDLSEGRPTEWNWTFQGGTPETSTAQNPKVIYETPGTYTVVLTVRNDRGTDTEVKEDYITVRLPRTDLTFRNNVFTDVNLIVGGAERTIPAGDSITLTDFEGFETVWAAETSGKTAEGDIVGLAVYWGEKLILNGDAMREVIDLPKEYFYLYITNNGSHDLAPLYVNYGLSDQTVDNVAMLADGKRYRTGYYRAHPGTIIRAYWIGNPDSYTEWVQGEDFTFHFTRNQVVRLTNSLR